MLYLIFLSAEGLTCFLCKDERHLAKFCPNTSKEANSQIMNYTSIHNQTDTELLTSSMEVNQNNNSTNLQKANNVLPQVTDNFAPNLGKRAHSQSSSSHTYHYCYQ